MTLTLGSLFDGAGTVPFAAKQSRDGFCLHLASLLNEMVDVE